ncbi:MAG: rRNA maturation RNase YbeY [Chthoniobacterales bacterium]
MRSLQRKQRLDLPKLQSFSERALQLCLGLRKPQPAQLTRLSHIHILLISDRKMAALHKEFLNLRGATDVITFQHGEIFVSVETALRNANRFGTSAENEVRLYIVHGLLHLAGFDDTTPARAREMERVQTRVLSLADGL